MVATSPSALTTKPEPRFAEVPGPTEVILTIPCSRSSNLLASVSSAGPDASYFMYNVLPNDTLMKVALRFDVSKAQVQKLNGIFGDDIYYFK